MEHTTQTNYNVQMKKLPNSEVELVVIIPAEEFDRARKEAIELIGKDVELPGFRKGHVPEKMLLAKMGESALLEEMAEITIGRAYPHIIAQEKLDVLGRPQVRLTKIAHGSPLECTIITAVFPDITLPDYKKIAGSAGKGIHASVVTDEDVEKTIEQIQRMRAGNEPHEHKEGEEHDEEKESKALPPLDDAYVKTLGDFDSVDAFKAKLRENIQKEKERETKDKKRVAIMEAIAAKAGIELPQVILDQELSRMEDEFSHEVSRMGMSIDTYLKAVKKTREEMQKDWEPDAEKRAKVQLLIAKIAEVEKITADPEALERDAKPLREQYPDAAPERIEGYLAMLQTNEKVFQMLENEASS
jgi:FKBP-type peptidyl-prolyl cis-trans isomerase (trigger factor)